MSFTNNDLQISIIIPVYNAENYIAECIESIIKQTVDSWILILVDDGSTDNSGKICEQYAERDCRIKVIHKDNAGPSSARNIGIAHITTKWFTFVDADDKVCPNYIENFHVERCLRDDILSLQGFKRVDTAGHTLGEEFNFKESTYKGYNFMNKALSENDLYSFGQSVGKLYNKVIVDEHGICFNPEVKWSEDHIFYLQYLLHVNEIHTHRGTLYLYQFDDRQVSLTHRSLPYKEALTIFHCLYYAAKDLVQCFKIEDLKVIKKINYHSVTAGFSNVLQNLYRDKVDFVERKNVLKILKYDMEKMRVQYNPNSLKGKFVKVCLLYCPITIIDCIFRMLIC